MVSVADLEDYAGVDYSALAHPYSDATVQAVIDHAAEIVAGLGLPSFATIEIAKALMDERMREDGQLDGGDRLEDVIARYESTKIGVVRLYGNGGYNFYY